MMTDIPKLISEEIKHDIRGVRGAINLFDEGKSLHFIARYRKDQTLGLIDEQLLIVLKRLDQIRKLDITREKAIDKLKEMNLFNENYLEMLNSCSSVSQIDDIMQPFRSKRKTKAMQARELGLQNLADCILGRKKSNIESNLIPNLGSKETQIEKALDIIAEELISHPTMKQKTETSIMSSPIRIKFKEDIDENLDKINNSIPVRLKSHQIHNLFRAEKNKIIQLSFDVDKSQLHKNLMRDVKSSKKYREYVEKGLENGIKRMLIPRSKTSVRKILKERADERAILVFKNNLEDLLRQAPIEPKVVMGIDPAYRSGCKFAVVDPTGDLLDYDTIYPTPPKEDIQGSKKVITKIIAKHKVEFIVIGNGTGSRETVSFIKNMKLKNIDYAVVSEDGASVYSASAVARDEFPDIAVEIRGAISIARRVLDPLGEFVKIDPKSLGIGQYQHDINQKALDEALNFITEKMVNSIGINLDTASKEALGFVSGITPTIAKNIVEFRESKGFNSLKSLKKVKRLGDATYEQCVGFLRLPSSKEPLDMTMIHPDNYAIALEIMDTMKYDFKQWSKLNKPTRKKSISKIKNTYEIDDYLFDDIKLELLHFGEDPRGSRVFIDYSNQPETIDDLIIEKVYSGTVSNVTDFGAFVELGIKENGLIHVSNLNDQFVSNVHDFIRTGELVKVKILTIDSNKGRIGLKLIEKIG